MRTHIHAGGEAFNLLVESWYSILKPYHRAIVFEATKRSLTHSEFAPRIGSIVNEIERMTSAIGKSDVDLWVELYGVLCETHRCRHTLHCNFREEDGLTQGEKAAARLEEIFNGLSEEVREYVGSVHHLCVIAEYDEEQLSMEKGRFFRTVPALRERVRTKKELPQNVLALLAPTTKALPN